jgi:hypothetical protein
MARLGGTPPARPLRLSYRHVTGRTALSDSGAASYESTLERDWLQVLDFDPSVTHLSCQPFSLTYSTVGGMRRYTPDVMARFSDGSVVVYEVKPREKLRAEWMSLRPRFKAASRYCRAQGWRFRVVTEREIRTPFLLNVTFLRRYRHLEPSPDVEAALLRSLRALGTTTPQALLASTCWCAENRATAVPYLWRLVATYRVATCLMTPLAMSSHIWCEDE